MTPLQIHSWNAYIDAQQRKNPQKAARWEMERMSEERVKELERISEARELVTARSQTSITGTIPVG